MAKFEVPMDLPHTFDTDGAELNRYFDDVEKALDHNYRAGFWLGAGAGVISGLFFAPFVWMFFVWMAGG